MLATDFNTAVKYYHVGFSTALHTVLYWRFSTSFNAVLKILALLSASLSVPVNPNLAHVLRHVGPLVLPGRHAIVPFAVAPYQARIVQLRNAIVDVDANFVGRSRVLGLLHGFSSCLSGGRESGRGWG